MLEALLVKPVDQLLLIERELRTQGWWDEVEPSAEALSSVEPFSVDTLDFEQWLQWIFLPRMKMILEQDLPLPNASGIQEMAEMVISTIRKNDLHDGYIRLIVTRGVGGLGLSPYRCETASIICIASTISLYPDQYYQDGLELVTCGTRRPAPGALSPQVKSLNYLNNVMAKAESIRQARWKG